MFHKEGFKIIINTFLLCAALALLAEYRIDHFWMQKALQLLSVVILILVLQFFRNPKRKTIPNEKQIISPWLAIAIILAIYLTNFLKSPRKNM